MVLIIEAYSKVFFKRGEGEGRDRTILIGLILLEARGEVQHSVREREGKMDAGFGVREYLHAPALTSWTPSKH